MLETAAGLEDGAEQSIRVALGRVLGREVTPRVQVRPELGGGVRLRLGGHVWDASLAGQLEGVGLPEEAGRG